MDLGWYPFFIIWAIVELVQFLRKRPLHSRMRTAAAWAIGCMTLADLGAINTNTPELQGRFWLVFLSLVLVYSITAAVFYGVRVLLALGWNRWRRPAAVS